MSATILAYIPVLHQGYFQLFSNAQIGQLGGGEKVTTLYVLTDELAQQFTPVHKELRALPHDLIISAIKSWNLFENVVSATETELQKLNDERTSVIIPDEIVTREISRKYLPNCEISTSNIFLRWDSDSATKETLPQPTATISSSEVDKKFAKAAQQEGAHSSDWWRQVGALVVRDEKILAQTHNTHLPSEQQPYAEGDPRAHFHKGDHIELTTAIHAEAKLIAEAAAQGLSLAGTDLYVTDFPCPVCAKLIAHAGIKKVIYQKGYAMLDGERVLKTAGVELIQVTT